MRHVHPRHWPLLVALCVGAAACGDPEVIVVHDLDGVLDDAGDASVATDGQTGADAVGDATSDVATPQDADTVGPDDVAGDAGTDAVDAVDAAGSDAAADAAVDAADALAQDATEVVDVVLTDVTEDALEVLEDVAVLDVDATADAVDDATNDADAADAAVEADAADVDAGPDAVLPPQCTSGQDCPAEAQFCTTSGQCAACVYDIQCGVPGATCANGLCTTPSPCTSDKQCTAKGMVCDFKAGVCRDCVTSADCAKGDVCWHNQCVAQQPSCQSSKDCPGIDVCSGGLCVPCGQDADCTPATWCAGDICVPDTCTPGSTQCSDSASAQICPANGSTWQAGPCPDGTACADGTCKSVVCPALSVGCDGNDAWACNATGTSKFTVPCTEGHVCLNGGCPLKVCEPNTATCTGSKVATCDASGTSEALTNCPANAGCVGGNCLPWVCTPGIDTCDGGVAKACTVSGQYGATISDCSSLAQVCFGGACTSPICAAGDKTCKDVETAAICAANGLSWDTQTCGVGEACAGGVCTPLICVANQTTCDGNVLKTCDPTGTAIQAATDCVANTAICLQNSCIPVICTPGATQCEGAKLATCNANGTAWDSAVCGANQICDSGVCTAIVCAKGDMKCSGNVLLTCSDLGTVYQVTTDCAGIGQFCIQNACVAQICTPGDTKCTGLVRSVCAADGMSWSNTNCDDGNFCTVDACDAAQGCSNPANTCDDGNACTNDACVGSACTHTNNTAPCDDGNSCTTGEACAGGTCTVKATGANVSTIAGVGTQGWQDGAGSSAKLNAPVAISRAPDGSFVVVESTGQRVRSIAADGTVSTLAGSGAAGSKDGVALLSTFNGASGVAVASDGSVLVADRGNHRIRKIAGGLVTTFAGSTAGYANGTSAQFSNPSDVAITSGGVIYVADSGNHRIRRIAPGGNVSTAAGTGTAGYVDGTAAIAQLNSPCALATGADGTVYFYDCGSGRVRKLTTGGTISTIAGAGIGFQDGAGSSALFGATVSLAVYGSGLLVADGAGNRIRGIDSTGNVSTLGGAATAAFLDGSALSARFSAPRGIAVDASGIAWIADSGNHRIRQLSFTTTLCNDGNPCTSDSCANATCTFSNVAAGTACDDGSACSSSDACDGNGKCAGTAVVCNDGAQCTADFCAPFDGTCYYNYRTASCDDGNLCTTGDTCFFDQCANLPSTVATIAGSNTIGTVDDVGTYAQFGYATGVTQDVSGALWIVDSANNRIRKSTTDGLVSTLVGVEANYVDGDFVFARFNTPTRLAFNSAGTAFITDTGNNRIRRIIGSKVSTFAGSGTAGYQDGASTSAQFKSPHGIAVDSTGVVFIADRGNFRIRSIAANGTVGTIAGSGTQGNADGTVAAATFWDPRGICVDNSNGVLYVADGDGYTLRKIANGQVTTLAGKGGTFGLVDGQGASARFNRLMDCAVDANHDIWVTDGFNFRLRKITAGGLVSTVAGATTPPVGAGDPGAQTIANGTLTASVFMHPGGIALSKSGTIYVADHGAIRKVTLTAPLCDDGQPCTTDACDAATGLCSHTNVTDATACSTNVPCTVSETCLAGVCQGGAPKNCDDSNVCTTDACTAATGVCTHTNVSGACSDNNACTPNDTCVSGACDASQSSVTTIAGAVGALTTGTTDGKGSAARFNTPEGFTWDANGNAWIADSNNHTIRLLAPDGTVTTVAGVAGSPGYVDGPAASAKFTTPSDIVPDGAGGFLIADWGNHRIRRLSGGVVSTVAGSGTAGYLDGASSSAQFNHPTSVDIDASGVIYVADETNHRIRMIGVDGTVGTLAGSGATGGTDGASSSASFASPTCARVTPSGAVWVADASGFNVRRVDQGTVTTIAGLYNTQGTTDGTGSAARFSRPWNCSIDAWGNLLVADSYAFRVRRVTPAGVVTTLFGTGTASATPQTPADGLGAAAKFAFPLAVRSGSDGNTWIADDHAIRKLVLPTPNCDDSNPCTADACNSGTGACTHTAVAENAACNDGNGCTTGETCVGGTCSGGTTPNCKDTNACTIDACDTWLGCTHTIQPASLCNDSNACTTDTCDAAAGCVFTPIALSSCNDNNACTTEGCDAATGCTHVAISCDDNNTCTTDSCDAVFGCAHTPNNNPGCCTPATGTLYGFETASLSPFTGGTGWGPSSVFHYVGAYAAYVSYSIAASSDLTVPKQAIPAAGTTKLNFYYEQAYVPSYALFNGYRSFTVVVNGTTVWTAPSSGSTVTWYSASVDLTPYAGTTPTIAIRMVVPSGYSSSTYGIEMDVDNIQINTTCP